MKNILAAVNQVTKLTKHKVRRINAIYSDVEVTEPKLRWSV